MAKDKRPQSARTRIVHGSRPKGGETRPVNQPVVRASTVLYKDMPTFRNLRKRRSEGERVFAYGTGGTPTAFALEDMVADIEGGYRTKLAGSGLLAIAIALQAYLRPGDHVLITDGTYEPVRRFAEVWARPFGIECTYFPADGSGIEALIKPNTRMIYTEVPGSLLFEMQDLPAICRLARSKGIMVAVDNTWGSGWLYKPLALGADVSIIAGTKHFAGHADVLLGTVTTTEAAWKPVDTMASAHGLCISPDDAYLALRGIRTMPVRLPVHQATAMQVCTWLQKQKKVRKVFYPPLPDDPGHTIWKRDFTGACGLFSIELDTDQAGGDRFIDGLSLFGIGASWGGYESLVVPGNLPAARTLADWRGRGAVVRLHVGLEEPADLIADIEQALTGI